jgi:hypothetical protein
MKFNQLPPTVAEICKEFQAGLSGILNEKLFGIYLYGAILFPESGPAQDIDCHVILDGPLCDQELEDIHRLHRRLAQDNPHLGEIDAYYILLEQAKGITPPKHQLSTDFFDRSWALHCAHVRAGRYLTLWGPEPTHIFPKPSWNSIEAALDHEFAFIEANLKYRAYSVLNLCRIMYSFSERDVVISKQFSGDWACDRFPEWEPVIQAAMRSYQNESKSGDKQLLSDEMEEFLAFAKEKMQHFRS